MFKRGIGHVEAILSFLLFIGFVFFALYFFIPEGNNNLIDSSLQYTLNTLSQNNSVEMLSFSVKINKSNVLYTVAVEFPNEILTIPANYVARAETYDGKALPTTRVGTIVYFDPGINEFAIIKFCEDFPVGTPAVKRPILDFKSYTLASSSTKQIISEKRILQMNNTYYGDYDALKSQLNLPKQINFGYDLKIGDRRIYGPIDSPFGVDIYSTLSRKEILKTNGEVIFGDMIVKVW